MRCTCCSQSCGALEDVVAVPKTPGFVLGEGGGDFGTLIEIRDAPGGALNSEMIARIMDEGAG